METSSLPMFIVIEAAVLAAGHNFHHWKKIWGALDNPVRLVFNYTYGTVSIIGSFVWWLLYEKPTDPLDIAHVIMAMSVTGGVVVVGAYGVDWLIDWIKNLIDGRKLDDILRNKHDAESKKQ